ncbi:hypothetical protein [Arsukibacterium sp.]|uniref:hypothetical protein n=1 Tax=Arsukibacterium sp. TaxID=1977258 RepID=UPI00299D829B|nr:hypothetical protein [Arsukibacterium sp.]MDX1676486.1 hypothetical protein [Arsukibacterium sp.]
MKNRKLIAALLCLVLTPFALAHKFSTAYMDVQVIDGQPALLWKVALHDLAKAKLIVAQNNHQVSWQQVMDSAPVLTDYLKHHLFFSSEAKQCDISPAPASNWQLQKLQRDLYLLLPVRVRCDVLSNWQLTYRALFASEPSHKLLLSWQVPGESAKGVLAAESVTFPLN